MITPKALGKLIQARRKAAKLSRSQLSVLSDLSESTIKNIEAGRHGPSQDTLTKLLAVDELNLTAADLLGEPTPEAMASMSSMSSMNCLILPGFDPIAMVQELSTRLAGRGGALEQSYLYLDTKSAACWYQIANQAHYSSARDLQHLHDLARTVRERIGQEGLDVIGLGCGDGRKEVRLVHLLSAEACPGQLVLYLMDISQPLLGHAFKNAVETLQGGFVFAIQGNFHQLPAYSQLLRTPGQAPRRRLLCFFGGTFGNLENEVRYVRDNLVATAAPGDLLLLHVSGTFGPRQQPEVVLQQDPMLAGTLSPELRGLIREWLTGPIERYSRPVGAPLPQMNIEARFDTAACPVPGSYAIEYVVYVADPSGLKRFTVAYVKRYDAQGLAACMDELGWQPLHIWERESGNMLLGLFQRRPAG